MKRFWSLLLVLALLASIVVVPVSAETGTDSAPTLSFEIGTFTYDEKGMGSITLTEAKEKYQENDLVSLAIKITPDSVVRFFRGGTFFVNYDTSVFEPFTATSKYGVSAGPAYTTLANWSCEGGKPQDGVVSCAVGSGSGLVPLDPEEGTQLIFYFLFKVKQEVESATCEFTFHKDDEAKLVYTETINPKDPLKDILGVDYDTPKTSLTIEGKAPTLGSVTISPEATTVFASGNEFTLSAKSASGKDITSLVTFKIQKDEADFPANAGLTIAGNKLTVESSGSLANVGTYTVVATPNGNGCTGSASAVFTITPATITNPTVTISNFGKGQTIPATATMSDGLTFGTIEWKDESGTKVESGKFAGSSTYTAVITFSADGNHQLAENSTVSVSGVDSQYVTGNQLTGPDAEGKYTVTLTLKTADKDTPVVKDLPTASSARWGMTLANVSLTGGSVKFVKEDGTEITVPGKFEWMDTTKDVGEPTSETSPYYRFFDAKFVPEDIDTYAVLENIRIGVIVNKVLIDIDTITNWDYTTAFQYNGEAHKVELVIPENLRSLVNVTYVDNEKTAVGIYTAKATISEANPAHYLIEPNKSKERTLNWEITKGTLSAENKTVEVRYGTGSKDLTLADLGLSALANEPGVDVFFDTANKGNVISTVGTQRDTDNKITGISITLQNTTDQNIGNEGSVTLTITSDNYETKTLTITVKIVNKDTQSLTVSGPASFPYGTTAETIKNALTVTGLPTGYDASKVTYTFSNSDISAAIPGSYTLTVSYEDDNNVYTGTYTFEITKLDLKDATIEAANTLTYTGSEQTQNVTVKYNGTTIDASNYTVTNNTRTDAGTQTLTVTAKTDSTLYTGSKTYEFTIAKATPTVDDFTVTAQNVTYDGKEHKATVAQVDSGKDMGGFEVSYIGTVSGVLNAPVDADEYLVHIKVNGNDNYNAATGLTKPAWKFTIAKATPTLEIETAANATYTGQPYDETSKITLTSASTVTPDTYLYFSDAGCTKEASPVNVGTYWIKAKFNGDTNHYAVTSAAKQFKITKASYSLAIEAASVEYNKTPYSSSNIKVTPNLSVHFGYYADEALTKSIDAPTEVGTYYVRAFYEGDANHNHAYSNTASFEIKKATPATPPEIKVDNSDTTLGELGNKMLVEIGVPGTIYWYGPDGKPITDPHTKIEANTEYSWTFVPADPDNYNSIEGKTTPYVRDDLSWLPGVLGGGSSFSFHDVTRFDYYYDSVKWAADNGIASGTSRFAFSPDAVCTRAQTVTFLWRAAGSPLPRYRVSPFTDVHSYDYYYEAVLWAVEQGITTGLTATTFGPDETVTRGQVATFLYRAASAAKPNTFNPFTDVKPTAYNYGAILWAYDNRITTGTSTTTFSPDAFCTRAQIVTFLYRYYQGR